VAGNEDRIKLLLSGDNPNRINRELQYMGYVSQAQAKLIETLRANQQAIRANKADTQNAKFELEEIAQEELEQKVLEREKAAARPCSRSFPANSTPSARKRAASSRTSSASPAWWTSWRRSSSSRKRPKPRPRETSPGTIGQSQGRTREAPG
jgi:septal ring factor EnvC (AmiA/AmiB activator)